MPRDTPDQAGPSSADFDKPKLGRIKHAILLFSLMTPAGPLQLFPATLPSAAPGDLGQSTFLDDDVQVALKKGTAVPPTRTDVKMVELRRQADRGEVEEQFELGMCFERVYLDAQVALGVCFHDGEGEVQDHAAAVRLFRRAAKKGHADAQAALGAVAQVNLGQCYAAGVGVPRDDSEAARFFRLAAEQGLALAQLRLGELLLAGGPVAGSVLPAVPGEAARFLAQVAQQTGDEEKRLEALALLSAHTHEPNVVNACCVGCGQTRKLRACLKYRTARFCGAECVRRMWPVHKQSCKTFAAAYQATAAAAADEHAA
ncbi:hypothetical protein T492DRAFT_884461 [Pavlovales sp. CCMP2436]|nr:hypothetical protein T492DRAFT_884461 [Pavlovales sp. CCMP2436]